MSDVEEAITLICNAQPTAPSAVFRPSPEQARNQRISDGHARFHVSKLGRLKDIAIETPDVSTPIVAG